MATRIMAATQAYSAPTICDTVENAMTMHATTNLTISTTNLYTVAFTGTVGVEMTGVAVQNIFELWDPSVYYSPYTSMVQVSMSGKTSILMKLGSEGSFFVVYCCLRQLTSSGYPPRSRIATKLLQNDSTWVFVTYFIACLHYLAEHTDLSPARFTEMFRTDPDTFWIDIEGRMIA